MRYKIFFYVFFIFFIISKVFSISLDELIECTLQNNSDILSAQNNYDNASLSLKTLHGAYAPQILFSSSTTLPNDYQYDTLPNYFSSTITYSQPLPGGIFINLTSGASFNTTDILEDCYLSQNPNTSISLSQSLLPYWIQGRLRNPTKLSAEQQKEYYYNQLLYTKKSVVQNLIQNYIYTAVYIKQIQINKNLIALLEEQIDISQQLLKNGSTNQAKITDFQSSKWSYQQDLLSSQSSFFSYLQNLKTICGIDFELDISSYENINLPVLDNLIKVILLLTDNISDPLEKSYQLKIKILKTNRTLEKQSSAPTLSLSVKPVWSFESKKQSEWKDAWKDINSPFSWTATIDVNLSPLLSSYINLSKKQYEQDYEVAENTYHAYITQKSFILKQYKTILDEYKTQLEEITNLYYTGCLEVQDLETQYTRGTISKFDLDSVKVRVENCRLNKEIIELYFWLYEFLYNTNL